MKNFILVLLVIISFSSHAQNWADDSKLEEVLNSSSAFGDDESPIIVLEYWAKFNEANAFSDWDKVTNVQYFRIDIAKAPKYKKEHRIRMAPTIIIWRDGIEKQWKAGLDLECPVDLSGLLEGIEEVKEASAF
tara:strand:+ start:252 stop:650 length:399 start_codon:yes stop_codon:yes gene_type:complete